MLAALNLADSELSVLLTNDAQIRELNRVHRSKDRPTDVLSFGVARNLAPRGGDAPRLLGDIVISLDTAARQAASRRRPLIAEVRWLLAHGVLHLLGFDHATVTQKQRMVAQTRRLVLAAELPASTTGGAAAEAKPRGGVKARAKTPSGVARRRS
jgi:probable rRNA maturation factor